LIADDRTGEPSPEILPPGKPVPRDSEAASARKPTGYRWHEGHWWYRLADGQWLIWTGDRWRLVSSSPSVSSRRVWVESRSYANVPPSVRPTNHGWVGGFYSSGGGYGASDFGYGYGIPTYGPYKRP
jgi:hypothetical protein